MSTSRCSICMCSRITATCARCRLTDEQGCSELNVWAKSHASAQHASSCRALGGLLAAHAALVRNPSLSPPPHHSTRRPGESSVMPAAASPEMRGIVGYVRDNLENATISGASAAVGVPQRTLHRRCRQEFGVSMRTFLREARIMRAMELLSSEDRTVGSVAASVGFNSPAAFTSTFSRRLGISPGEFMRVNRSGQQAREAD